MSCESTPARSASASSCRSSTSPSRRGLSSSRSCATRGSWGRRGAGFGPTTTSTPMPSGSSLHGCRDSRAERRLARDGSRGQAPARADAGHLYAPCARVRAVGAGHRVEGAPEDLEAGLGPARRGRARGSHGHGSAARATRRSESRRAGGGRRDLHRHAFPIAPDPRAVPPGGGRADRGKRLGASPSGRELRPRRQQLHARSAAPRRNPARPGRVPARASPRRPAGPLQHDQGRAATRADLGLALRERHRPDGELPGGPRRAGAAGARVHRCLPRVPIPDDLPHRGRDGAQGKGMSGNSPEGDAVRDAVRDRYAKAALYVGDGRAACCSPSAEGCGCGTDIPDACGDREFGSGLYSLEEQHALPDAARLASLGCGNPSAVAELREGETVLDLGSGGGIDVLLSARRVGSRGKAYGLDMTDEMLALALENKAKAGATNVEFLKGHIEAIPLPSNTVDVIISNCVINLSGDKRKVLAEAFRVLKPGGRFAVSDVITREGLPNEVKESMAL